jgi:hypothetical protein
MWLISLAHPTRFERVTFAFGGQRSNYAGQSRNAPFDQSQESGAVCSRPEPIKSALATSPAIPETDGTAMGTKSEAAPMASNSHPVISVPPSDRANPFFIVTQTAADTITSYQKTRGEGRRTAGSRIGAEAAVSTARYPARQREEAAC